MYPEARCFVEYLTAMRPDLCDLSLHMSTSSSHQGLADSLPSITSTYEQPLLTPNVVPGAVSFEQQYQNSRGNGWPLPTLTAVSLHLCLVWSSSGICSLGARVESLDRQLVERIHRLDFSAVN